MFDTFITIAETLTSSRLIKIIEKHANLLSNTLDIIDFSIK